MYWSYPCKLGLFLLPALSLSESLAHPILSWGLLLGGPERMHSPRYRWLRPLVDSVLHHSRLLCLSLGAPWGQGPRGVSYSARAAIIKYHGVGGLNNRSLTFQLWRLEVKMQAERVSDETPFLSLQTAPSHCILTSSHGIFCEHACKLSKLREREFWYLFLSWLGH